MRYPILALFLSEIDQGNLNCVSLLRDFEVKMDRFQIKQNVLNVKSTLIFNRIEGSYITFYFCY